MSKVYTARFLGVNFSANADLFEIVAPTNAIVELIKIIITQGSDVDSEQLTFSISRTDAAGSGGTAIIPTPTEVGFGAYTGTVHRGRTPAGTKTALWAEAQNILNGWVWPPTPLENIVISPSGILCITLESTPADVLSMHGTIVFVVKGG